MQTVSKGLQKYVDKCLPVLRLWGWRVTVDPVPIDDDWAEIRVTRAQHTALLKVGPEWAKGTNAERRETIAHELLHCYTEPVVHKVVGAVKSNLTPAQLDALLTLLEDEFDVMADELSRAIAPLLPEYTE